MTSAPEFGDLARALAGETALVLGALAALAYDLTPARHRSLDARWQTATVIGVLSVLAAFVLVVWVGSVGAQIGGIFMLDPLGTAARAGVLGLAGLTLMLTGSTARMRNPAEFVAIVLLATAGFMLMAVSQQLLVAFLAIELASLSLYVLAGFDKTRPESAEAALKYFLVGGTSAAFLLFGFSLLYGLTGSIDFVEISRVLSQQGVTPLLSVALIMVVVSFGFKTAAAPFHLWAPDAYQGAPVPAAALIASASKLAGIVFFFRLLWPGLGSVAGNVSTLQGAPGWLPVVALLSASSLLLGNIAALAQSNLRRLLAYSAIAHAGALLLGLLAAGEAGPSPLYYYAITYGIATVGAFGIVAVLERAGVGPRIEDLVGLHRRSPFLAGCLTIFILSLAGIPPLAGFFGKFFVFAAALKLGGVAGAAGWLAFAAIFLSAVALYYYLIVLKQALVVAAAANAQAIVVPTIAKIALFACAGLTVLFGVCPEWLLQLVE